MAGADEPQSNPETQSSGPRTSRRMPFRSLVAVDAPELASEPWVVDATDVNSLGMGLVLPAELREGTPVLLSFKLAEDLEFSRVPATVAHYGPTAGGGVRFDVWSESDRLRLLEYLVKTYETFGKS